MVVIVLRALQGTFLLRSEISFSTSDVPAILHLPKVAKRRRTFLKDLELWDITVYCIL
jgi:hypothetical protein